MRTDKHGDTMVEVLLAIALMSAILFTSWGIVNRATQIGLAARQRIDVVNQLKEQAEILQAQRDNSITTFRNTIISGTTQSNINNIDADACNNAQMSTSPPPAPATHFYFSINPSTNALQKNSGYKVVGSAGDARIWVQYIENTGAGYIDFYIRGCWNTSGTQTEDMSQFILRLNTS